MSKNHITIAKPDASRSCHHCKWSLPAAGSPLYWCKFFEDGVEAKTAETCNQYRDTRRTSQVISASGKVFD